MGSETESLEEETKEETFFSETVNVLAVVAGIAVLIFLAQLWQ